MDYKKTLNLPKTAFEMKANLPEREPSLVAKWQSDDLYGKIRASRASEKKFLLHDGPPYANGDIHIGHALNKIIKDLIVRFKTMRGFDAPYVPGWDCHGMPIEHQLFKELKITKRGIEQVAFREKARVYAQRFVDIQREQFKRLGILGDWERPYLTMSKDYEVTILSIFRELVEAGYIYWGKKPVYWCATCETALAEAEVEYEDRNDLSIYVEFPLTKFPDSAGIDSAIWEGASIVVWTTTPWTLPANIAVCFHPEHDYSLVLVRFSDGREKRIVLATGLVETVLSQLKLQLVKELWKGEGRVFGKKSDGGVFSLSCKHPYGRADSVGVTDQGVNLKEGTGIVHIAPGHGQEDYLIGQRERFEVFSPVNHQGRYTDEVSQWAGESVWDANPKIVEDLKNRGILLGDSQITHSYPHCWRCNEPVIFRATPQWFLSVDNQSLRRRLLDVVKKVSWVPDAGLSRISGMLESRPDWCLSRQRYWGSPIPILHCDKCDQPLLDAKVIAKIEQALKVEGVDAWFSRSPTELVPDVSCPGCKGKTFRKDTDILDVWFDSGVSHEAVLKTRKELSWPADLYVEGSDQHRGWFQVSLIPAVALRQAPPYRQVLTHGFVMDGEGRKMSKSLGNVIAPQEVMERYGADILRLWVASCDYREDVRISDAILNQVAEAYRKIRNTFRYLLANLSDFDPSRDSVDFTECPEIDRWALQRMQGVLDKLTRAYDTYEFHEVFRTTYHFCVIDLSSFYLDALKDRLYTEGKNSKKRLCAQTTLYAILTALTKVLAPILAFTTDEVWQLLRDAKLVNEPSVHLAKWPSLNAPEEEQQFFKRWETFLAMRDIVMKALESKRTDKLIRSPLEAQVTLMVCDPALEKLCEAHIETLAEVFVVSQVAVKRNGRKDDGAAIQSLPGLVDVRVERASGDKCGRCWKYAIVGEQAAHPQLCKRCAEAVVEGEVEPKQTR